MKTEKDLLLRMLYLKNIHDISSIISEDKISAREFTRFLDSYIAAKEVCLKEAVRRFGEKFNKLNT